MSNANIDIQVNTLDYFLSLPEVSEEEKNTYLPAASHYRSYKNLR